MKTGTLSELASMIYQNARPAADGSILIIPWAFPRSLLHMLKLLSKGVRVAPILIFCQSMNTVN
jgi:hypothetical protein